MILLLSIVLPLAAAALAPTVSRFFQTGTGWLFAAVPASIFAALLGQANTIQASGPVSVSYQWVPSLNVSFDLRLDGLGLLFALLITGVGSFIFIYAGGYLAAHRHRGRFFSFLLLFMAGMLGIALADNLIAFFVFWEITSVASYLLIGFNHEDPSARAKALQALLVTGTGGVALLAGFIIVAIAGDSYRFSELVAQGDSLAAHPLAPYAIGLILLGCFTKSAQFPFHFWLPNAMAAPTPVSAYLHSATMVKAGVFLLLKLSPIFASSNLWTTALVASGSITFLLGAISGLFQKDLKRILAFTTMSVLGLLTFLVGLGGELAIKSALLFLFGHSLYKAALFMTAGNIDHGTGTRNVLFLGGLRVAMPVTAAAAGLAALSKGGFPPLVGFIGKEYIYKAGYAFESASALILLVTLAGNALLLALAFKVGVHPFWSRAKDPSPGSRLSRHLPHTPHEAPASMLAGPVCLSLLGLLFALAPSQAGNSLLSSALSAAVGYRVDVSVQVWHGFNLPLLLSIVTLILGITLYLFREYFWRRYDISRQIERKSTERCYDFAFTGFVNQSKRLTRRLQNGSMRFYLWTIICSATALLGYAFFVLGGLPQLPKPTALPPLYVVLCAAIVAGGLYAAAASNLIKALAGLGLVGYGIALVYAFNGAPDLAITQIAVETLTIALLLLAVLKIPQFRRYSSRRNRIADGALAACVGLVTTSLVLKSSALELAPTISAQLAEWSYVMAKGRNIVNVILVDFRAIDTFGEIVVLGIAALGVSICLENRHPTSSNLMVNPANDPGPIFKFGARIVLPICVGLALIALYRGHNEPGGGFIGGLVFATGYILYAMAYGVSATRKKLRASPVTLISGGLLVAAASGLLASVAGKPFMTGLWLPDFSLPFMESKIHLGTPLLFDLGVFLVVIGFSLQVLFAFQNATASPQPRRENTTPTPEPVTAENSWKS